MVSEQPSLAGLEPTAIAGSAGDLIIWNSFIPHGNAANTSDSPRLAQFVTMVPADSTGNEGLDVPGIWRNGGLSYADHEVRAARGGDGECRDDECVREELADQARAADGLVACIDRFSRFNDSILRSNS